MVLSEGATAAITSLVHTVTLFFLGTKHTGNPSPCLAPTCLLLHSAVSGAKNPLSKSMKKTQITCQSVLPVTEWPTLLPRDKSIVTTLVTVLEVKAAVK